MAVETKNKTGFKLCMLNAVLPGMVVVIIRGRSEKEVRLEIKQKPGEEQTNQPNKKTQKERRGRYR